MTACDRLLGDHQADWLAREIRLFWRRVLKRLDVTARSVFALVEPGSCFAGTLLELALAADRSTCSTARGRGTRRGRDVRLAEPSFGAYPMANGLSRLQARFLGEPHRVDELKRRIGEVSMRGPRRPPGSSRSRPTTSTGTTRCASPSRSAPRCRPTR